MNDLQGATTAYIDADNGVKYAYRHVGADVGIPLVMHIHFRANMDFWDPVLINAIARTRPVILFDQAGVGGSSGIVPKTFQGWADDLIAFIDALKLQKIDLFGFSLGGVAVQAVALKRPDLVRKLILAGTTAPQPFVQVPGVVWPREVADPGPFKVLCNAASLDEGRDAIYQSFFPITTEGRIAFEEYWSRLSQRHVEPLNLTLLDRHGGARNQRQAVTSRDHSESQSWFNRLKELKMPVLIANGDNDVLIPTSRSWELLTQLGNASLIIYPRAGHGFLWQYAEQFAKDINAFLDRDAGILHHAKL